jgi:hypothetical protein
LRPSARVFHRILKLARTIADLQGSPDALRPHLAEALSYRAASDATTAPPEATKHSAIGARIRFPGGHAPFGLVFPWIRYRR